MRLGLWVSLLLAMTACSAASEEAPPALDPPDDAGVASVDASEPQVDETPDAAAPGDAAAPPVDGAAPPVVDMAAALLAKLGTCSAVSTAPYAADNSKAASIQVCGKKNAVSWKADMDIDCDGKPSAVCSKATDPSFQSQTAASDSKGGPLDAATLPYVVVPQPSARWDYRASGLALGTVVAVIYAGKIEYGIIGDVGPAAIIGEASYAMAKGLGINPNPRTGGVGAGVTYVAFTGKADAVKKKEDHAEAVSIGKQRAAQFLKEN